VRVNVNVLVWNVFGVWVLAEVPGVCYCLNVFLLIIPKPEMVSKGPLLGLDSIVLCCVVLVSDVNVLTYNCGVRCACVCVRMCMCACLCTREITSFVQHMSNIQLTTAMYDRWAWLSFDLFA
jgi:glycerol-3-phosphate acyltransferase PlsY